MSSADAASTGGKSKVFVSYSRKDMAFADKLDAVLKANNFEPLIDRTEIYAFEDWWKRIQSLIAQCDTVIFALSPDSVASEVCGKEVAYAASLNKRFAPVVVHRVDDKLIPEALARLNFIFFDDDVKFDDNINLLTAALATDIDWIRKHTEFGEDARSWEASGKPSGLLLRSPRLEEAERWIIARPANAPTPTEGTQAFIVASRSGATKRRNILTGSLAAGLIIALALAAVAYWQRSIAIQQRQYAETALDAGITTSNDLAFTLAQRLRDQPGLPTSIVKYMLDGAVTLQDKLTSFGRITPDLQKSRARALLEVSVTRSDIGDNAGALTAAQTASQLFESVVAADPNDLDEQHNLTLTYVRESRFLETLGEQDKALAAARKAVELSSTVLKSHQGDPKQREQAENTVSIAYVRLGDTLSRTGQDDEALAAYRSGLAIEEQRSTLAQGSTPADVTEGYGSANERIGDILFKQGKRDEALAAFQKALSAFQTLNQQQQNNSQLMHALSVAYNNVGNVLTASGKFDDALASFNKALAIRETLANGDKDNVQRQRDAVITRFMIGDLLAKKEDPNGALAAYQAGVTAERSLAIKYPDNVGLQRDIAVAEIKFGEIYRTHDKLDAALPALRDSASILANLTKTHPDDPEWQNLLPRAALPIAFAGYRYLLLGQFAKSLDATDLAISFMPDLDWIKAHRAHALMMLGRSDEAQRIYMAYRSNRNVFDEPKDQLSWIDYVLSEFDEMRKAGINSPLMNIVQKQLANNG